MVELSIVMGIEGLLKPAKIFRTDIAHTGSKLVMVHLRIIVVHTQTDCGIQFSNQFS